MFNSKNNVDTDLRSEAEIYQWIMKSFNKYLYKLITWVLVFAAVIKLFGLKKKKSIEMLLHCLLNNALEERLASRFPEENIFS